MAGNGEHSIEVATARVDAAGTLRIILTFNGTLRAGRCFAGCCGALELDLNDAESLGESLIKAVRHAEEAPRGKD